MTLQRAAPPLAPDTEESSLLESTSADLPVQFGSLTVDDSDAGVTPSAPGGPGPAASTPRRPADLPRLSSPPPSWSSPNPAEDSAEEGVSLEMSISPQPAEKPPTAPPGGAKSCDTFYSLCCTTKVTFRGRGAGADTATSRRSKVTYSMIGGLNSQLDVIRETIELPLKHPELFANYGRSRVTALSPCCRHLCCHVEGQQPGHCRDPAPQRGPSLRTSGYGQDHDWPGNSQ